MARINSSYQEARATTNQDVLSLLCTGQKTDCTFFYTTLLYKNIEAEICEILSNISNMRRCVSSDFQTLRSRLKKRGAADFFFKRLRGVWISDETHSRVFDMASQMINNSWRNSRLELAKFYGN